MRRVRANLHLPTGLQVQATGEASRRVSAAGAWQADGGLEDPLMTLDPFGFLMAAMFILYATCVVWLGTRDM